MVTPWSQDIETVYKWQCFSNVCDSELDSDHWRRVPDVCPEPNVQGRDRLTVQQASRNARLDDDNQQQMQEGEAQALGLIQLGQRLVCKAVDVS